MIFRKAVQTRMKHRVAVPSPARRSPEDNFRLSSHAMDRKMSKLVPDWLRIRLEKAANPPAKAPTAIKNWSDRRRTATSIHGTKATGVAAIMMYTSAMR